MIRDPKTYVAKTETAKNTIAMKFHGIPGKLHWE
jgi:hypothetical protein